MPQYDIHFDAGSCSGCLRCGLACSQFYTRAYNPVRARLHIVTAGDEKSFRFDDACTACGQCADQCFYGALTKTAREEEEEEVS